MTRHSKRFSASRLQDVLVLALLVVLATALIAVIVLVVLVMIGGAPK